MEKWKNKKTIRGMIIGLVVVVTLVVAVVNTKITPAKSVGDTAEISREVGEKLGGKKSSTKDGAGTEKDNPKEDNSQNQKDPVSDKENVKENGTGVAMDDGVQVTQGVTKGTTEQDTPLQNGTSTDKEPAPQPVKNINCSVAIRCDAISGNGKLTAAGHPELEAYAANPEILGAVSYTLQEGASAYDILKMACEANGIQIEVKGNTAYNSVYVKGIHYLYEFSAGTGSGWMYQVNGSCPNVGASSYQLSEGDVVTWYYVAN